eukprot:SAG11_NODE_13115_length_669_cov_1.529825_1_plen_71_part_10
MYGKYKWPTSTSQYQPIQLLQLESTKDFDHLMQGHSVDEFPRLDENQEYEFERTLAKREDGDGRTFYLVKW